MSEMLLNVRDLTVKFGQNKVVQNVSFHLKKNEVLGIVGESGSGKSMTCLSLLKLIPKGGQIASGSIELFTSEERSDDLLSRTEDEMRQIRGKRIALIFQEPFSALNPIMTCGKQIREMTDQHLRLDPKEANSHILNLLERVGIHDPMRVYSSYPHELSGGQLQRVLIAMAVSCHPDVIIADEPTTALDVTVQKNVLELFKDLQKEFNCSIIFVSHDLGVIKDVADRVLVMRDGQVVEEGEVDDIFYYPKHPYTKGLVACRPPLDQKIIRLPTVSDFYDHSDLSRKNQFRAYTPDELQERQKTLYAQEPLFEIPHLQVVYPGKTKNKANGHLAVHIDDLKIYPGEVLGVVGESGSGKSSLGQAILKLNRHGSGSVFFKGIDLYRQTTAQLRSFRKSIQIIFQDPYSTLNPKMRIGAAIEEVLRVHQIEKTNRERKERVIQLLERCGLTADHYDRYPHEFSGGQRQRISIARTLAVDPEFIVCDESVSALDVSVQAQILNLLRDLQEEKGLTYFFISHDLSVIHHMADRILVLQEGKVVESGMATDVFQNPQTSYTQKLIKAIPGQI